VPKSWQAIYRRTEAEEDSRECDGHESLEQLEFESFFFDYFDLIILMPLRRQRVSINLIKSKEEA